MIVRNIEAELRRFFHSQEKKALLVTGARQVGKTYIIEALGRQAFSSFVRINFIENKQARSLFEGAEDSDALLLRLSALAEYRAKEFSSPVHQLRIFLMREDPMSMDLKLG